MLAALPGFCFGRARSFPAAAESQPVALPAALPAGSDRDGDQAHGGRHAACQVWSGQGRFGPLRLVADALLIQQAAHGHRRHGKTDVGNLLPSQLGAGHADHLALGIEQRPAAVARVDRRIDLQQLSPRFVDDPGDRTAGDFDAVAQHARQRVADHAHLLRQLHARRIAEGDRRQDLRGDLQHGQIVGFVEDHDFHLVVGFLPQSQGHLRAAAYHVRR